MDFDMIDGLGQMIVSLVVCCGPIVLAVGAIIVLLVIFGRRKPKAEAEPKRPSPPKKAAPAAEPKSAAEAKPKAVAEPDLTACGSCGADNPADNAFCEYCGASLAKE
jgi:hypothetical protein